MDLLFTIDTEINCLLCFFFSLQFSDSKQTKIKWKKAEKSYKNAHQWNELHCNEIFYLLFTFYS